MKVLLGVSGSVSCYRAADIARDLMRAGHDVRVCLTDSAAKFVSPILFETLTENPCLTDTFEEPITGQMAHIDWAREADVILIAPCTANTTSRLAHGVAADMLTTIVVASTAPLLIAPAMNPSMYASDQVQWALGILESRAATIITPQEGDVASGEVGLGKLAPNPEILEAVETVLARTQMLAGKHVVVTSGPTEEPIDDVRFLTNRSSGKMGAAVARAALLMGARVTVIAGPQTAALPLTAAVHPVKTAVQMLDKALEASEDADWIIGVAAVADYRPESPATGKLRRSEEALTLRLVPNPDIIATLAAARPNARVVAFAAEPDSDITVARQKIIKKGVFAIAANDISRNDIGFGSENNDLTLIQAEGEPHRSGKRSKLSAALWLLEKLVQEEHKHARHPNRD